MKGYVEIYQGDITENNLIFSEENIIVDSAAEHIIDVFTTHYIPSALASTTSGLMTSALGIKAITLGCAQSSLGYTPSTVFAQGVLACFNGFTAGSEGQWFTLTNTAGTLWRFYLSKTQITGATAGANQSYISVSGTTQAADTSELITGINSVSGSLGITAANVTAWSQVPAHIKLDTEPHNDRLVLLTQNVAGSGGNTEITSIVDPILGTYDFGSEGLAVGNAYNAVKTLKPIDPSPVDTTLQPPIIDSTGSGPGHLGHFLNYANFSATYALTEWDARRHGCYHPTGVLNNTSSVNSEGFIIESRVARTSQTFLDASAGFVVSGLGDVSATREVRYIITLGHQDWNVLDALYGGLGAIGLWTLDAEKTLDNYTEGSVLTDISLYNETDVYKNPVFKLFAKKVFLPGGLKLLDPAADDSMSIVWSIKF